MPSEDLPNDSPLVNLDKLQDLLSLYKFPLILAGIGIFLFTISVSLLVKNQNESSPLFFQEEASLSAKTKIRVDIAGEVLAPGVYEMEEGSRIIDALGAAGGLSAEADREYLSKNLNQAAKLVDGSKIYIPSVGETNSAKSSSLSHLSSLSNLSDLSGFRKMINLNTASQKELEALPGVGPVTAEKIIAGRPYQAIEELKNRKIMGTSLYEKLKDSLTVY